MIEKKLGNVERVVRLVIGLGLFGSLAIQPAANGIDWFVAVVALFLLLNGVFSRCYLWYVIELNTHNNSKSCNAS